MAEWERQHGETGRAYTAFCAYRDLGPQRSLNAAYQAGRKRSAERAPGHWCEWSVRFRWVERAAAYDAFLEAARRREKERALRQLEERRFLFELQNQGRLERRVERMETVLSRVETCAVTDETTDETREGPEGKIKKKTTTRAIKLSGYARLVQETNETARQAIMGVRGGRSQPDDCAASGPAQGEFVWVPPSGGK